MRFSDHRGLKPSDIHVPGNTMCAKLTRSCCFSVSQSLLSTGWTLLKSVADFPRDVILPAAASNCNGCLWKQLPYDTGFAIQNRVLAPLQFDGQCSLTRSAASFWTPHSARSFFPSATAALSVPKEQGQPRRMERARK